MLAASRTSRGPTGTRALRSGSSPRPRTSTSGRRQSACSPAAPPTSLARSIPTPASRAGGGSSTAGRRSRRRLRHDQPENDVDDRSGKGHGEDRSDHVEDADHTGAPAEPFGEAAAHTTE